ncbi:hypothetical protein [Qipengyuania flava]|uniref:hypothetical protein n=1 Tax=Qipengyuania flava TaxID=192812 RepID=UPI001C6339C2|nr:hypothetical protein [Qipengyuania flava]QYJ06554.1 hypothetical protein KUV82_10820 [Qipengyuania flava]
MKKLLAACLALACATPAHADWEGIKWGMKESQVEAADTDVEIYRLEEPKSWRFRPITATLGGKWTEAGHEYDVLFFFNEKGKLDVIEMEPVGVECRDLLSAYGERFGDYEENKGTLGPAQRTAAYWRLGKKVTLSLIVIHFPSSDEWNCKSTLRAPFGR